MPERCTCRILAAGTRRESRVRGDDCPVHGVEATHARHRRAAAARACAGMGEPTHYEGTGSDYLSGHAAACEEIGGLAWLLAEVVRVADDADGMAAGPLREELRRIAGMARRRASVQRMAREVGSDG